MPRHSGPLAACLGQVGVYIYAGPLAACLGPPNPGSAGAGGGA